MRSIDQAELKELLIKCWMTHDGMWFYHCFQEFGIEAANRMNRAAIRSLAAVEIERIRKAFSIGEVSTFEDLKEVVYAAFGVATGDFMGFLYSFPSENLLHWEMERCFAYDGIKRIGAIERYDCGVIYRVACWFDHLGIEYELSPRWQGCLMHSTGQCSGDFRFMPR